jgi:hypothetical protein
MDAEETWIADSNNAAASNHSQQEANTSNTFLQLQCKSHPLQTHFGAASNMSIITRRFQAEAGPAGTL